MSKTIKIPDTTGWYHVWLNGKEYKYKCGTEVEVPDGVAEIIGRAEESRSNMHDEFAGCIILYNDGEYLYPTSDTYDESKRLTRAEFMAMARSGNAMYVCVEVSGISSMFPCAWADAGEFVCVMVHNFYDSEAMTFFTAERASGSKPPQ